MDLKVGVYLTYLVISIGLTVWVATTLSRNGRVFLAEAFASSKLASSVNHLLVVGFYLLNLGYVSVALRSADEPTSTSEALETLSEKIGLVLLVLGLVHFFNVFALGRYRRNRLREHAPRPPFAPSGRLPMTAPAGYVGPTEAPAHQGPPAPPAHQ